MVNRDLPDIQRERRTMAFALLFSLLVWPTVWLGLYGLHSAPLAFTLYHALCFVGGSLLRSIQEPVSQATSPPGPHWRGILITAAVTTNLAAFALYHLVGGSILDRETVLAQLTERGLPSSAYIWLFPYFVIVNPIAEEWFWRGGIYGALRDARSLLKPWQASCIAALFFGAWHWLTIRLFVSPLTALFAALLIAVVGFALNVVYERTRSLIYPILLHALGADMPILLVLTLLERGTDTAR